jgi:hypothetical protein
MVKDDEGEDAQPAHGLVDHDLEHALTRHCRVGDVRVEEENMLTGSTNGMLMPPGVTRTKKRKERRKKLMASTFACDSEC